MSNENMSVLDVTSVAFFAAPGGECENINE
jgi:hypothetical protein